MSAPLRVLLIEDSEDDAALLLLELRPGGFERCFGYPEVGPRYLRSFDALLLRWRGSATLAAKGLRGTLYFCVRNHGRGSGRGCTEKRRPRLPHEEQLEAAGSGRAT